MKSLRTPDHRFENLPDYDFERITSTSTACACTTSTKGLRDGDTVLLLHGEPSWSYLYRIMIPPLLRCRPSRDRARPDRLRQVRQADAQERLQLRRARRLDEAIRRDTRPRGITLFCQDWGSLIGLRVAAENEQRFARIALGNGGLPTGDQEMPKAFMIWRAFARYSPWFPIGRSSRMAQSQSSSTTSSQPTTRPSRSSTTKPARAHFPCWCRRRPTTRPAMPIARRGRYS